MTRKKHYIVKSKSTRQPLLNIKITNSFKVWVLTCWYLLGESFAPCLGWLLSLMFRIFVEGWCHFASAKEEDNLWYNYLVKILVVQFLQYCPLELMSGQLFIYSGLELGHIHYEPNGSKQIKVGRDYLNVSNKKHLFSFPIAKPFTTVWTTEYDPSCHYCHFFNAVPEIPQKRIGMAVI